MDKGISLNLTWIPAHKGMSGNEIVNSLAKEAIKTGYKPNFKVPFSDFYVSSKTSLENKFKAYLTNILLHKGTQFFMYYAQSTSKTWYKELSLNRKEIVVINRLRSNYYNLNYSLHRKNMIATSACEYGDSHQDKSYYLQIRFNQS